MVKVLAPQTVSKEEVFTFPDLPAVSRTVESWPRGIAGEDGCSKKHFIEVPLNAVRLGPYKLSEVRLPGGHR